MKHVYILLILISSVMFSQNEDVLPFREIPDYPDTYTTNLVAARMIDGLGFRYYWASEGLRTEDLLYKPSPDAREAQETIDHIYGLSKFIRNNMLPTNKDTSDNISDFKIKRQQTLMNLKAVSDALKSANQPFDLKQTTVPFWNIINGPVEDAVWHCGQVVMMRRASGNPFTSNVSLFSGKVKK